MSRDLFENVFISVRCNLIEIAKSLSSEIRERFPQDDLLEAMSVVYPEYWNNLKCQPTLKRDFVEKLNTLVDHFCKKFEIHGEQVEGILDQSKLFQQVTCFAETMWNKFCALENPLEHGAITRL
jgi:hypothetical protein